MVYTALYYEPLPHRTNQNNNTPYNIKFYTTRKMYLLVGGRLKITQLQGHVVSLLCFKVRPAGFLFLLQLPWGPGCSMTSRDDFHPITTEKTARCQRLAKLPIQPAELEKHEQLPVISFVPLWPFSRRSILQAYSQHLQY